MNVDIVPSEGISVMARQPLIPNSIYFGDRGTVLFFQARRGGVATKQKLFNPNQMNWKSSDTGCGLGRFGGFK